jgi:hypothetical protein
MLLCKPNVHHRFHEILPLGRVQSRSYIHLHTLVCLKRSLIESSHLYPCLPIGLRVFFWHVSRADLWVDTNVSEENTASIFKAEDGGNMFLRNAGIYL